jgi:hypothetical protein
MEFMGELAASMAKAASNGRTEDFDALSVVLTDARQEVRETLQRLTADSIMAVIAKLEENEPLTPEEKNFIRLWVVGDAESYAKAENNYQEWLQEFRRLADIIRGSVSTSESAENLLALSGILEDANRLAADLRHYLEEKDRVSRFNAAIENLTPEDGAVILSILRGMLTSPEM